jgi:hypothetical protein
MKRFIRTYKTKYIKNPKEFANFYKKQLECSRCGFNLEPAALHFHHVDASLKKYEITYLLKNGNMTLLIDELSICSVLCANCHAILHFTSDDELRENVQLSLKPIDIDFFISCTESFGLSESRIQNEFLDDTEYSFEGKEQEEVHNVEDVVESKKHNSKRCLEDLTENDIIFIKRLNEEGESYRTITALVFGEGKFGKFYNDIVKEVLNN